MKSIEFSSAEIESIAEELKKSVSRISMQKIAGGAMVGLILWRPDGAGLCFRSKMHDIAPRVELGVLDFSKIGSEKEKGLEGFLDGRVLPFDPLEVFVMSVETEGVIVESGVLFRFADGCVSVFCGASPYTLVFNDSRFRVNNFNTEYQLSEYSRRKI